MFEERAGGGSIPAPGFRFACPVRTAQGAVSVRRLARSWCERGDSNPHGLPHWHLKPARLPIPPLSRLPTEPEYIARPVKGFQGGPTADRSAPQRLPGERDPRAAPHPCSVKALWIPAFAGMTTYQRSCRHSRGASPRAGGAQESTRPSPSTNAGARLLRARRRNVVERLEPPHVVRGVAERDANCGEALQVVTDREIVRHGNRAA